MIRSLKLTVPLIIVFLCVQPVMALTPPPDWWIILFLLGRILFPLIVILFVLLIICSSIYLRMHHSSELSRRYGKVSEIVSYVLIVTSIVYRFIISPFSLAQLVLIHLGITTLSWIQIFVIDSIFILCLGRYSGYLSHKVKNSRENYIYFNGEDDDENQSVSYDF